MDSKALIGGQVRELREGADLSQEQLGALAGVHRTSIGAVERGECNSTIESLEKIAYALRVPLLKLFEKCVTVPKRPRGLS